MNERRSQISPDISMRQRQAADPTQSVWVAANAGSGKTHVLTLRVLRLLLTGVAPENILCLTYTKAAAANMRARVARELGRWALSDEENLRNELQEMTGQTPSHDQLTEARTLFARALETPGGLKINTIHAFCEALLHRFPIEAGVPFDFSVLDDAEKRRLIEEARLEVLTSGLDGSGAVETAVQTLFDLMSDAAIEKAIGAALGKMAQLRRTLSDPAAARANLWTLTGFKPGHTPDEIEADCVAGFPLSPDEVQELQAFEHAKNLKTPKFGQLDPTALTATGLFRAFLKKDMQPPKNNNVTKDLVAALPEIAAKVEKETDRLATLCEALNLSRLVLRSEALLEVLGAILSHYEAAKRARALLDFDDLIDRTKALLARSESADWVRYKLDASITHVLVDESQDTNPDQWAVFDQLVSDFFSGDGAIDRPRTLFSVGDEKQSIYGFQGADPHLASREGEKYRRLALASGQKFEQVELKASFRTLPAILDAVDLVCADPAIGPALVSGGHPIRHESARADPGGKLVLWPPVEPDLTLDENFNWPERAEDSKSQATAETELATRIATTIKTWIESRRPLGARQRAVEASDILILVQSRKKLFHAIIRALRAANIPSPGADRLPVTTHIAILDLLALADVLLHNADDLQLAALLRSPLFDISETQLFELAHKRADDETLWHALQNAGFAEARSAAATLAHWSERLAFDRPYELFANVLFKGGGLRRFHARLGNEVDDVLYEFLDLALEHEREPQPSLQGFLANLRATSIEVARELAGDKSGVRIMTLHGAKGLEAPITILADATQRPGGSATSQQIFLHDLNDKPLLVHAGSKAQHTEATSFLADQLADREAEEYWRRFYVGMTRAEDELYLTGYLDRRKGEAAKKLEGSWYASVETALVDKLGSCTIEGVPGVTGQVFPAIPAPPLPITQTEAVAMPTEARQFTPVVKKPAIHTARPSAVETSEPPDLVLDDRSVDALSGDLAARRGSALHALLHHLSKIDVDRRPDIAHRAIGQLLADAPKLHEELVQSSLSILANPAFQSIFGPDSRGEVPFLIMGNKGLMPVRIAGRFDRLIAKDGRMLVVDFKSDAAPPASADAVPPAYLAQMGIYFRAAERLFPNRTIDASILWTANQNLMPLSKNALLAATDTFTLA